MENPREGQHIKKLMGEHEGKYRYEVGDLRIVYRILEDEKIVLIEAIGPEEIFTNNEKKSVCLQRLDNFPYAHFSFVVLLCRTNRQRPPNHLTPKNRNPETNKAHRHHDSSL